MNARRTGRGRRRLARRRSEALMAAVEALKRRFGEHIIRLGADFVALPHRAGLPPLSTGSLGLDLITGGLRRGQINEYAGDEGAGAEALAAAAVAACQREGGLTLLIDADGAVDPDALAEAGVDVERLILATPTTAREGWAVLTGLSRSGALDLLVLASLPGLLALPREGWDGIPAIGLGELARRLGRVTWALHGRATALLLVNRLAPRYVGYSGARGFPPSRGQWPAGRDRMAYAVDAAPAVGGPVVAQAAALRIALDAAGVVLTPYGDVAALRTRATVVKHHGLPQAPPIPLTLTVTGLHREAELVALGQLTGLVQEAALGLVFDGTVLGRTPDRAARTVAGDDALAAALEQRIRGAWWSSVAVAG